MNYKVITVWDKLFKIWKFLGKNIIAKTTTKDTYFLLSFQTDARETLGFQNNTLGNNKVTEIIANIIKYSKSIKH